MFRWPLKLTPLSVGSDGAPREAILEVTPRGAAFTLAALSHVGHPAHLALIDAYLKSQVRLTPTAGIGEDSRIVAASLAAPLVAAHELGVERLTLADLVLMPRDPSRSVFQDTAANGLPTFTADSPRLLLRAAGTWHWVRVAERFEAPGCQGTRRAGLPDPWHQVIAEIPDGDGLAASARADRCPAPILAEVRAPTGQVEAADSDLVASIRSRARCRPAHTPLVAARADRRPKLAGVSELSSALAGDIRDRLPAHVALSWRDLSVDVSLAPYPDGYLTLCLLPPADAEAADLFEPMRDLTWETIEGLTGRPLPERRTEPIALRLVENDVRATVLDVGVSVVIGRNQTVFAAWVGSDGRVMLKLFPPGGMPVSGVLSTLNVRP